MNIIDCNDNVTGNTSGDLSGSSGDVMSGESGDTTSGEENTSGEIPMAEGEPQAGGSGCPKNDVAIVMTVVMSAVVLVSFL